VRGPGWNENDVTFADLVLFTAYDHARPSSEHVLLVLYSVGVKRHPSTCLHYKPAQREAWCLAWPD
jgi:hypothetical protein